ncbi:MAG: hypothetical protein ABIV26_07385 [Candidatus Limnocylindrales bacterium]
MTNPASNRARRFSLPDLSDQGVDASIDAFLSGPAIRRGRPDDASMASIQPFGTLETRVAWSDALRRESARNQRYRRPVAVAVIAARPTGSSGIDGWMGRVAGPIAHTIQRGTRETDLVTRAAEGRFQILLPETTGPEATRLSVRLAADCEVWLRALGAPVELVSSAVAASAQTTLEAALERALEAIDTR